MVRFVVGNIWIELFVYNLLPLRRLAKEVVNNKPISRY